MKTSFIDLDCSSANAFHRATPDPVASSRIGPLLKWPGGKESELGYILPALPHRINRYFEPFVGGGAVFLALSGLVPSFINDKSRDLMDFYHCVAEGDSCFFETLGVFQTDWDRIETLLAQSHRELSELYWSYSNGQIGAEELESNCESFLGRHHEISTRSYMADQSRARERLEHELKRNLVSKIRRTVKIAKEAGSLSHQDLLLNLESALKSAYYMHIRHIFNSESLESIGRGPRSAVFFFIREYAYAAMFRFNKNGKFNVPYGGIAYNRKNFSKKVEHIQSRPVVERLSGATKCNLDFTAFFEHQRPQEGDFIFVDPPYDSDFSDYDKSAFDKRDQARLAEYLLGCPANYMLVIKNTDYISSLYDHPSCRVQSFDKTYMWTIKERNDREVEHLLITNY